MMIRTTAFVAAAAASSAMAGHAYFNVNAGLGPAGRMNAFDFSDGSNGAFADGNNRFSNVVLRSIHDELNDFSNVETDNKLTFVLGNTSEGLAMFALFDRFDGGTAFGDITRIGFTYTGDGFQNNNGEVGYNGTTFNGTFEYVDGNRGDAFAAVNIGNDFSDIFVIGGFTDEAGNSLDTYGAQVLSLNTDGTVQVIDLGTWGGGTFAFAVPMPAASGLAGVALMGLAVRRRR